MNQHTFADYIYGSPAEWGEYTLADESSMNNCIESLNSLPDWENCDLSQCEKWEKLETIGNNGIYRRCGKKEDYFMLVEYFGDGYYHSIDTDCDVDYLRAREWED